MTSIQSPETIASRVSVDDRVLEVALTDGRILITPLAFFPWLLALEPAARAQFEIVGEGTSIWWPAADEGLSVPALFGQPCE